MSRNRGNSHSNESAIISSRSAKPLNVLLGAASGAVVGIALAPLVTPTLLSIPAVGAVAGKLPPQIDQLVKYHLSPREPLGTIIAGKIAVGSALVAHSIAACAALHPIAMAYVTGVGALVGAAQWAPHGESPAQ
jgi:hypothetical protein